MTWYDASTLPPFAPKNLFHVRTAELLASPELQVRLAYPKRMSSFIDRLLNAQRTGKLALQSFSNKARDVSTILQSD